LSHLGEQHGPLSIPVQCPSCRWTTKVRQELVGKKIRCKQCSAIVLVVSDGTAAAPAAAPVAADPVVPAPTPTVAVPPVTSSPVPTPAPVAFPAPAPAPAPTAPAVIVETLKPPVPMAVTPAPAAAPKPAAVTSSAIDVLVSEVSQLKTRLIQMETQKAEVERRAALAEKAFQEAAGQHAVEGINTRRRIAELEAQIAELESQVKPLRALLAECKADAQTDLQAATQRTAVLQQRVSRLG
jgi:hypothetical protein